MAVGFGAERARIIWQSAGGTPPRQLAGPLALLGRFFDGFSQLFNRPIDLLGGDDRRRRDQHVVAGGSVDTPLNGIDQQAPPQGGARYPSRQTKLRSERRL